ncbi:MAG: hypothetical protein J3R72DRAFT_508479 [Linnemannia gamsii]|nr:MAG: hypothetical protein J3R72DRAFT_508479 [Linnemannia gamsii]
MAKQNKASPALQGLAAASGFDSTVNIRQGQLSNNALFGQGPRRQQMQEQQQGYISDDPLRSQSSQRAIQEQGRTDTTYGVADSDTPFSLGSALHPMQMTVSTETKDRDILTMDLRLPTGGAGQTLVPGFVYMSFYAAYSVILLPGTAIAFDNSGGWHCGQGYSIVRDTNHSLFLSQEF